MNEALRKLLEERDTRATELEALIENVTKEARTEFTETENETRARLVEEINSLDERLDDETSKAARKEKLDEARRLAGVGIAVHEEARVTSEPKVYGDGAPYSYFLDLARRAVPQCAGHDGAVARLAQHGHQMTREAANDTREGRAALNQYREISRVDSEAEHRDSMRQFLELGRAEQRDATPLATGGGATVSVSGGAGASMVIPPVFVDSYVPYETPGRAFADSVHHETLPESGMTLYVPNVTAGASVASFTENGSVSETTPTFGMLSGAVNTYAGNVEITQVMLDRASLSVGDRVIADSLNRQLAVQIDTLALTTALANATSIVDNSSTWAVSVASKSAGLFGRVSQAKAGIRTAAGVYKNPNLIAMDPTRFEVILASADANARPLVLPEAYGVYQALGTSSGTGDAGGVGFGSTGRTGFSFNGLGIIQDPTIPAPASGHDQVIVMDSEVVYLWEGTPVPRVIPATKAPSLVVYIQLYSYAASIKLYDAAVAKLSGTFFATPTWV